MTKLCLPSGPLDAKIAFVGEAPGESEERECKPFVGTSGKILDEILASLEISRDSVYLTNVMQIRPAKNDFGEFYLDSKRYKPTQELLESRARLLEELRTLKPNIIIALGDEVLRALTTKNGIDNWRGCLMWVGGIGKLIPTFHPNRIIKTFVERGILRHDIQKAIRHSLSPSYDVSCAKISIPQTMVEVRELCSNALKGKKLSFDIETFNTQISCISFSYERGKGFSIPLLRGYENYWSEGDTLEIWDWVRRLLGNRESEKIGQNATFDSSILSILQGVEVVNLKWDTMIMSQLLYPWYPKDLGFLCSIYTEYPCYWEDHFFSAGGTPELYFYNGMDSVVAFEVEEELEKELIETGMLDYYTQTIQPTIYPIAKMQNRGISIDIQTLTELRFKFDRRLTRIQRCVELEIKRPINLISPKQVAELLYTELKLPAKYKKGRLTTDVDAVNELYAKHPDKKILERIKDFRSLSTIRSNHLNMGVDLDNRVRCSFNLAKVYTGRLASSANFFGSGTNLQNVPRVEDNFLPSQVRQIFIPDQDEYFVEFDLSQADARIVALISQCQGLLRVFNQGQDIHTSNACMIYNVEPRQVSKRMRYLAKRIVHASNYGMMPRRFVTTALKDGFPVTLQEATTAQNLYFERFPEIRQWQLDVWDQLRKTRTISTLFGRKVEFLGRLDTPFNDTHRDALALTPQGTVAEIINKALVHFDSCFEFKLKLQGHDSLLISLKPELVPRLKIVAKNAFNIPVTYLGTTLLLPFEMKIGKSFGEMEKEK